MLQITDNPKRRVSTRYEVDVNTALTGSTIMSTGHATYIVLLKLCQWIL